MRPLSFWGGQGFNVAKIQGCKVTAVISGATCSEASSHGHDPWGQRFPFQAAAIDRVQGILRFAQDDKIHWAREASMARMAR